LKTANFTSRFLILPDWHFPNLASRILIVSPKTACRRLAVSLRSPRGAAGDLCGPPAVSGHHLQSGHQAFDAKANDIRNFDTFFLPILNAKMN
jgi:hypothetical protein